MTIDVPLADVGGIIAVSGKRLGYAGRDWLEVDVVDKYPVRERKLPCQQAGPVGRTDRTTGDSMAKVDGLAGQAIQVWGLDDRVAGISGGLSAPLVGKYKDDVRSSRAVSSYSLTPPETIPVQSIVCSHK